MAENLNLPSGAVPPKPMEAAKVQPKKETVRINLPPKPTAAATIKLPTPTAAPAPPLPPAHATGGAPTTVPQASAAAPVAMSRPVTATAAAPAAPRSVVMPQAPGASRLSVVDVALALVSALIAIGVLVRVILLGS